MKSTGRMVYRDGKPQTAYKDTEHANKGRRSRAKFEQQSKRANIRAKYGPSMRIAPVTVRDLETGEVKSVIGATTRVQRAEIRELRKALKIKTRRVPPMSNDADRLITWLKQRASLRTGKGS